MATAQRYQAGFSHLNLNTLARENPDLAGIQSRVESLQQQLTTKAIEKESALRNLLGISLYAQGQYEQAYEQFSTVLKEDQDNLNALEQCKVVLEKLNRSHEARPLEERLSFATTSDECIGLMLLEQAYAKTFEVYDKATQDRYMKALELYEQGLKLKKDLAPAERVEWMICQGVAYHKLLNLLFSSKSNPFIKKTYSGAIMVFHKACKLAVGLDSESMCWSYLGLIFSKPPKNDQNIDRKLITDNGLTEFAAKPELCFEKALGLTPISKETACRYAGYVLQKHRRSADLLNEVLEFLNGVIVARPPDLNWFVYCRRANVLLALYEVEKSGNKAYLRLARDDYKMVDNKNKQDIQAVAKIQRYLAE